MLSLPPEINFVDMLSDYMQYVALFIPVFAAFFAFAIVKKILRKG
jgi:hypothetical protein